MDMQQRLPQSLLLHHHHHLFLLPMIAHCQLHHGLILHLTNSYPSMHPFSLNLKANNHHFHPSHLLFRLLQQAQHCSSRGPSASSLSSSPSCRSPVASCKPPHSPASSTPSKTAWCRSDSLVSVSADLPRQPRISSASGSSD